VVPGKVSTRHKKRQRVPAERKLLGVFRGSLDASLRDANGGRVRKANRLRHTLFDALEGAGREWIFSGHKSNKYVDEMDNSRFCIIPRGNTPWTRRFFDAVVRGCIPAVLSDPVAFPFERLVDYSLMTIKCGKHAVPSLFTLQLPPPLSSIHAVLDSPRRPCHYAASHPIIAARV
jgi:hypothetical protein